MTGPRRVGRSHAPGLVAFSEREIMTIRCSSDACRAQTAGVLAAVRARPARARGGPSARSVL